MVREWIRALAALGRRSKALWTASPPQAPEQLSPTGPACIIDYDNLFTEGHYRRTGRPRPPVRLDFPKLAQALSARDVGAFRTIYRNRPFSPDEEQSWRELGFKTVSVGCNCDPHVIRALFAAVKAGYRELILIAGDDDYTRTIRKIRARNVWVEVWSRSDRTAGKLARAANAIQYIDHLILRAPRRHFRTSNAVSQPAAVAASSSCTE